MVNAKEEFLFLVADEAVVSAVVEYAPFSDRHKGTSTRTLTLYPGYTPEEYTAFIEALDFDYNAGFGTQELFGFVWFSNGAWAERGEYDGSEWWDYKIAPSMPAREVQP